MIEQLAMFFPNKGDTVYYIRGFNPQIGEVFDRLAIFKKTIAVTNGSYFISTDGEILVCSRVYESQEQAEKHIKQIPCVFKKEG